MGIAGVEVVDNAGCRNFASSNAGQISEGFRSYLQSFQPLLGNGMIERPFVVLMFGIAHLFFPVTG